MAEVKGQIVCDSCGGMATLKKLKNSENLYLHCTKCGCDRRTGAGIQAKWQAAVNGGTDPGVIPENPETIQDDEISQEPETAKPGREWKPSAETHKTEQDEQNPEKAGKVSGRAIVGGAVMLLSVAGFFYKLSRG